MIQFLGRTIIHNSKLWRLTERGAFRAHNTKQATMGYCRHLLLLSILSSMARASDMAAIPRVLNITSVINPSINGMYVISAADEGGSPTFVRSGSGGPAMAPKVLYRSTRLGTWLLASSVQDAEADYLSTRASDTPMGLSWRFRNSEGKWPSDKTLHFADVTSSYDAELAIELSKVRADEAKGLQATVVRRCSAGVGRVLASGEVVQEKASSDEPDDEAYNLRPPASFECPFRSAHCYDGSPIFCDFSVDFASEIVRMYEHELEVLQGEADRLDRTLHELDGHGQTHTLFSALQSDLKVASFRVYILEPWFRFRAFVAVADAIILFSSFATLGLGLGIGGAFLYAHKA